MSKHESTPATKRDETTPIVTDTKDNPRYVKLDDVIEAVKSQEIFEADIPGSTPWTTATENVVVLDELMDSIMLLPTHE